MPNKTNQGNVYAQKYIDDTDSPYTYSIEDGGLFIDVSSDVVVVNLPAASSGAIRFPIKDISCNAASKNITINRNGTDTIITTLTAQTSYVMSNNGEAIWLESNGVDTWYLY